MIKTIKFLVSAGCVLLCGFSSFANNETLKKMSEKYRAAKLIEMTTEKTVKLELQGRETKYLGRIFLGHGKFRWENKTPEETLLVFDGSTIWSVQSLPKELGGGPQIARGKVDKRNKSQILISTLTETDPEKNFKVLKETRDNFFSIIEVSPIGNNLQIEKIDLTINTKDNTLDAISYKDDLGNQTTIKFVKINFSKVADDNKFKYQPPKGAQVTDL